ncbi:MAG: hypothetical protein HY613_10180 [Candidatus Rokubacteria bacterium]|nr:hypothetical protein [Candidatus Rokubacteria bacterium]
MREHRVDLINKIEYWAGVRRSVVRALVDGIGETAERLQLYVETKAERTSLVELTTYATTLSMNYLARGSFVPRARADRRAPHGLRPSRPHRAVRRGTRDLHRGDRERPAGDVPTG